jgi:hypothetical protein
MSGTGDLMGEIESFKSQSIGADKLGELGKAVQDLKLLNGEADPDQIDRIIKSLEKNVNGLSLATLESVLKWFQVKAETLARNVIPNYLNDLQLSELKLASGEKITVKNEIKASITDANKKLLIQQMAKIEADYRGITLDEAIDNIKSFFKEKLLTEFNPELENEFIQKGLDFEHKIDIHYQTLNKYVRDNIEQGLPIPESINVFQYQEAKIK